MPSIEFKAAVLCEEVRREASGQSILIGASMVGPPMHPEEGGELDRIAFYLEALIEGIDEASFRLINLENDDIPIELDMQFDFEEPLNVDSDDIPTSGTFVAAAIVFNKEKVKFSSSGVYELQYTVEDNNWETIRSFVFPSWPD